MVGKNLTIVLIFVAVLAVGFFGYQHFKTNKDLEAHHQDTYSRLTQAAKKSPRAGMAQMGRAINKYYAKNKSYPTNLNDLYPDYVSDQSFINDVNWNYQPTGNNFQLSKSVVLDGRPLVASTDKSINVRTGTTTVAMVDKEPTVGSVAETSSARPSPETVAALERLAKDTSPTAESPEGQTETTTAKEDVPPLETETRTVVLDETETPSGLASELSNAYLVWKDEQGRLGFGNVQYPRSDGIAIATPYNWYNIKSRPEDETSGTKGTMTSVSDIDMEAVASKYSDRYLVWKDKSGNIGFGDTEYPDQVEIESVNIDGTWHKFAR
jgi:hypothetical protein